MPRFKIYRTKTSKKWILYCSSHDTREECSSQPEAIRIMGVHFRWWHTTNMRVVGEPRFRLQ